MTEFVRIQDNDGGKATVGADFAKLLEDQGAAKVIKEPAVDPIFGTVLPTEPPETDAKPKTATVKKDI